MTTSTKMPLKTGLIWSVAILGITLAISAYAWLKIPAGQLIPIHWGLDGQADGFAHKTGGLLAMPLTMLGTVLLFILVSRIEPRQRNIALSAKAYTSIWVASLALLAIVHAAIVAVALGWRIDVMIVTQIFLGLLFVVMGNYLGKVRSNFVFGIRTPWTLSSEYSWNISHRFGGKMMVLLGLILLGGVFLNDSVIWFVLLFSEMIVITVMLSIYSYILWRHDPARVPDAGQPRSLKAVAMLTVLLMCGLAVAAGLAHRQLRPAGDFTPTAVKMIEAMAQGDFQGAEASFDRRMKTACPPNQLNLIWNDLTGQHGEYQRITGTRRSGSWPFSQVFVNIRFTRATVTMRVVFMRTGTISGLWLAGVQEAK